MKSNIDTQGRGSLPCSQCLTLKKGWYHSMMEVRQKELRNMAGKPYCEDITHGREEDYQRIMKEEGWLDTIAYSTGLYGRSGTLYRGHNTGKLYVITSRTSAIYIFP